MDSVYRLGVELSLAAPTLAGVAGLAMRQFQSVQAAAESMDRSVHAINFSLNIGDAEAAANRLMQSFAALDAQGKTLGGLSGMDLGRNLKAQMEQAQAAVSGLDRTLGNLNVSMALGNKGASFTNLMNAFKNLEASGNDLAGSTGVTLATALQKASDNADLQANRFSALTSKTDAYRASLASLNEQIAKSQFVYPDRGIPGMQVPGAQPGVNFPDNATNRAYQYQLDRQRTMAQRVSIMDNANLPRAQTRSTQADTAYTAVLTQQKGMLDSEQQRAAAAQTALATQVGLHASQLEQEAARQQAVLNAGQGMMLAGGVATMLGGTGFGFFSHAAQAGMSLQRTNLTTQIATGASAGQMNTLANAEFGIGLRNQMSEQDVATIAMKAAQTGVTDPKALLGLLPSLANFAEVLKMTRGTDPGESSVIGVQLAHLFGAVKDPVAMANLVNLAGRAMQVTPGTPQRFETIISQYQGLLRTEYGPNTTLTPNARAENAQSAIQFAMLESFLGQQGRGGYQLSSFLQRLVGTSSRRSSSQMQHINEIAALGGGNFFDKNGVISSPQNILNILETAAGKVHSPQQFSQMMVQAFGAIGIRQAGLFADPATLQTLALAQRALATLPSMQNIQQQYNQTPQGQFNQAQKNLATMEQEIGKNLLPVLSDAATALAGFTHNLAQIVHAAPGLVGVVATFLAITSVVLLIMGPLLLVGGSLALMGIALGGVAIAGIPVIALLAALIVGIPLLTTAFILFHDQIAALIKLLLDFAGFLGNIPALGGLLGGTAETLVPGGASVLPVAGTALRDIFGQNPTHKRAPASSPNQHAVPVVPRQGQHLRGGQGSPTGGGYGEGSPVHVGGIAITIHGGISSANVKETAAELACEVERLLSEKLARATRYGSLAPVGLNLSPYGY